jgi:hypothetical protein
VPASIHSLYARSQPAQAVRDLMEQNDLGVEQEMLNLRTLGRIMLELLEQTASAHEIARLSEAYTGIASLVSEMLATHKSLPDKSVDIMEHLKATKEAVEAEIDREWALWGLPPGVRPPLLEFPENDIDTTTDACEEIASTRLVLGRLLDLALRTDQVRDFLHLSLLYARQCRRLVRILRHEATRRGPGGTGLSDAECSEISRQTLLQVKADHQWLEDHGYKMAWYSPEEIELLTAQPLDNPGYDWDQARQYDGLPTEPVHFKPLGKPVEEGGELDDGDEPLN